MCYYLFDMNYNRRPIFDGRNGADELSATLIVGGIAVFLAYPIFDAKLIQGCIVLLGIFLIALGVWRAFSTNIAKRRGENATFMNFIHTPSKEEKAARKAMAEQAKAAEKAKREKRKEDLKTHVFYNCPKCHQELRVPRGKGKIRIKCPKCGEQFIKKT